MFFVFRDPMFYVYKWTLYVHFTHSRIGLWYTLTIMPMSVQPKQFFYENRYYQISFITKHDRIIILWPKIKSQRLRMQKYGLFKGRFNGYCRTSSCIYCYRRRNRINYFLSDVFFFMSDWFRICFLDDKRNAC